MMKTALAILAILIVLFAGCTGPSTPSQGNATTSGGGTPSGGGAGTGSGAGAAGAVANEATCTTNCLTLTDADMADICKAGCYMESAETSLDASRCDPIGQMVNMSVFYDTCLGNVAGKKKSTAPCERLTNSTDKDWCLLIATDEWKEPSVCDKVEDSIMKSVCIDDTNQSSK